MKKLGLILTLGAAFVLAAGTHVNAQTLISGNFQGGDTVGLAMSDSTGAPGYVGTNWNNITGTSGGPITLNNSTGTPSPVILTVYTAGPFGVNGPDTDNSTAQKTLFSGSLDVNFGAASFTLDGLSAFSSYSIVAYYTGGDSFASAREAQITATDGLNAETYYVAGIDSVYTAFTQSNSTDSSTYESGNYVVFSGLTGDEQTLSMHDNTDNVGLVGFQILGTPEVGPPATPEPSTWALMIGGLGLLIGLRRLRRPTV